MRGIIPISRQWRVRPRNGNFLRCKANNWHSQDLTQALASEPQRCLPTASASSQRFTPDPSPGHGLSTNSLVAVYFWWVVLILIVFSILENLFSSCQVNVMEPSSICVAI